MSENKYFYFSGLPRCGSTLLSEILNQNPDIYVGQNSPVLPLMARIGGIKQDEMYLADPKQKVVDQLISSVLKTYHSEIPQKIIFDKNREWTYYINDIHKYLSKNPKIICPVRSVPEILTSFISLLKKNNYPKDSVIMKGVSGDNPSDDDICKHLLTSGIVYTSIRGLVEAWKNHKKHVHLVHYNHLVNDPKQTLENIYNFLELEQYNHQFENISSDVHKTKTDAELYKLPSMHEVRSTIKKVSLDPMKVLSPEILKLCNEGIYKEYNTILKAEFQNVAKKSRILFATTHPSQLTGYAKMGSIITNYLADHTEYEVFYYAFQNSRYIASDRYISPLINFIDTEKEFNATENGDPFAVDKVYDVIKENQIDVFIIYNDSVVISRIFNNFLKKVIDFKIVCYLDLVYNHQRSDMLNHINKYSDHVFVFTDYWRQQLISKGFNHDKVDVFYHGIPEFIKPVDKLEARKQLRLNANDFIFLNTNRNNYRKGWDKTIEAFLKFYKKSNQPKDVKLFINCYLDYDHGYDIRMLITDTCEQLGLDIKYVINNVILISPNSAHLTDQQINQLYNSCDVGINTCMGEGFGLCTVEQASLGITQVVNLTTSMHDVLPDNNEFCFKVPPIGRMLISRRIDEHSGYIDIADSDKFANIFCKLYTNREKYSQKNQELRNHTINKYNWEKLLPEFVDKLNKLI